MSRNLNKLYQQVVANHMPAFNIQHFEKISELAYAVAFDTDDDYTFNQYQTAVANVFDNNFTMVPGTLHKVHGPSRVYRVVLAANIPSKEYTDENVKDMHLVSANVFSDDEDRIWKVIGEGGSRRLVQTSTDDFEAILNAKRNRTSVVAAAQQRRCSSPYMTGDYVAFYDSVANNLDFGFVIDYDDKTKVLSRASGDIVEIHPCSIVASVDISDDKDVTNNMPVTAMTRDLANQFLEYWRAIYSDIGYFKKLEKAIKENTIG